MINNENDKKMLKLFHFKYFKINYFQNFSKNIMNNFIKIITSTKTLTLYSEFT